jgi:hypothetical protein
MSMLDISKFKGVVKVYDLSSEKSKLYVGTTPIDAVIIAYAESQGENFSDPNWKEKYLSEIVIGNNTIGLGNFAAMK